MEILIDNTYFNQNYNPVFIKNEINFKLPNICIKIDDDASHDVDECCICFEKSDIKTSCGHFGCFDCFKQLNKTIGCPYCRQEILHYRKIEYSK